MDTKIDLVGFTELRQAMIAWAKKACPLALVDHDVYLSARSVLQKQFCIAVEEEEKRAKS